MVELTVAAGLLGMVFLAAIPLLGRVRETREDAQQRFLAVQEAANAMEQLALDAADGAVPNAAGKGLAVSAEARDLLPEVTVEATSREEADDVGSVRVTVTVAWTNDAGEPADPVTLDAWLPVRKEQP
jgi:type II secretory pathway pseudopilin PulG